MEELFVGGVVFVCFLFFFIKAMKPMPKNKELKYELVDFKIGY